ncbi:(2S)-methylsuccinyl-CoA dehydrogenase [Roseibium hamelinense]|uniref:(2S)-methylsuccinyl-CoA dehydrogenase n=1 Tax=Roseibium hamelinense TaxID=150831 RepID=A0A562SEX5_9HYPH|nr:acyl-CoA dehydrogenase family protein [Roseibium hamelinense]MTI42875.1 acyl-CoA dehydrogenase [Roseibium hamelinense]TWI79907.1 (2S)-methylsuccinyl-CoA dehydrogenase [Roseibium hamelinense]
MPTAAVPIETPERPLLDLTQSAVATVDALLDTAAAKVRAQVVDGDRISSSAMEREQRATHGLAWLATYVEALRQLDAYGKRLSDQGAFGELEECMVSLGFSEYLSQVFGGIPMNQTEFIRLTDLYLDEPTIAGFRTQDIESLISSGNTTSVRSKITNLVRHQAGQSTFGNPGLDDTMEQIRNEMRRFAEDNVAPHAHEWHLKNEYIPLDVVSQMAELGVFGLTIPEEYGGLGLGKEAMCVVSEELSRAYIGVGSLGTRSEIAAELILCGGTEEQKQKWLPKIASAEILPTAVFTEPNTGSDLASLKTRAIKKDGIWKISGNKTWITHPVRADVMTLLARTNPDEPGYKGLSMFLAEKPRGSDEDPFPATGMSGGEIEVLGYRGMKEYEIAFDDFEVAEDNLLGGVEGEGFKQLMQTFEGARIQTAARAIGVAQSAVDLGLRYAEDRIQFGKALIEFPRVSDKLALMATEVMIARQLTYFSAWEKDSGRRCDLEAGMAKLLGARVAWAAADNALQIHGGNGFALEYAISRVLCDARILNIFEGAAEIQAQVIARRILETRAGT